jgi:subtilisin family serine protease
MLLLLLLLLLMQIGDAGRSDDTSAMYVDAIRRAYNESAKAKCDVINMSFAIFGVTPDEGEVKGMQAVVNAGVIPVAAAGNGGGNKGEAYLWSNNSPGMVPNVIAVAAVNNSKIPVTTFLVNRNVTTGEDGPSNVLCEFVQELSVARCMLLVCSPVDIAMSCKRVCAASTGQL